jgi:choline dehydrogenase-like flavoprotein
MVGAGISRTTLDWNYPTVPQTNLNGRNVTINAGKALGGSTVINSMFFVSDSATLVQHELSIS